MRILFDQGTPVPLRRSLHPHKVDTASEMGWSSLTNGELISAAEKNGFDAMITTDQSLKYQQNLSQRKLGIIVLKTTSWPRIRSGISRITKGVNSIPSSGYLEIEFD